MNKLRVASCELRVLKILVYCLLFTINCSLFTVSAWATHENDHRYKVYGEVRDNTGKPTPDVKVMITLTRVDEGNTVFTDKNGHYETILHIHSENLGDEIIVNAKDESKKIRAEFDPNDKSTERGSRVDFGQTPSAEKGSDKSSDDNMIIYIIGIIIIAGIIIYFGFMKKKEVVVEGKSKKKK